MKGGEWVNKANFFNCVVWGKYAEAMQKHLTKGRQIGVIGELDYNAWTDNSGGKHHDITIAVNSISPMAQPKNGGDTGGHEPPRQGQAGGSQDAPDNPPF
jgi:single-strand DNA-binding protein